MIPGRYHVDGVSGGGSQELREHGIILIGLASAIIYLIGHFLQSRRSRKEKKSDHNSPKEIS